MVFFPPLQPLTTNIYPFVSSMVSWIKRWDGGWVLLEKPTRRYPIHPIHSTHPRFKLSTPPNHNSTFYSTQPLNSSNTTQTTNTPTKPPPSTGVASGIYGLISFTYPAEMVGASYRGYVNFVTSVTFALGISTLPILAYFVRDWRMLSLYCALPGLFGIYYY